MKANRGHFSTQGIEITVDGGVVGKSIPKITGFALLLGFFFFIVIYGHHKSSIWAQLR